MRAVYSPCIWPLEYTFNSRPKKLAPDAVTVLPGGEARHVTNLFKEFGVIFLREDPSNELIGKNMKRAAKVLWEKGNKRWAEKTLLDWHTSTKAKREAGVPVEEPNDVKVAREFLKKYADGERQPLPEWPEPEEKEAAELPKREAPPAAPSPPKKKEKPMAKKGRRVFGVIAAALLLPALAGAQELRTANVAYLYDVDSTSKTYCKLVGERGDPFAGPIPLQGRIQTSGSSTTVTEETTGDNPFEQIGAGDVLVVDKGPAGIDTVAVVTKASSASVTVNEAVDWSNGYSFKFYDLQCGTGANDGWIPVGNYSSVNGVVSFDQGDIAGLDFAMECKYGGLAGLLVQVYPGSGSGCGFGTLNTDVCTFSSTTFPNNHLAVVVANNGFEACRLALAYRTSDTSDSGTNREEVSARISVSRDR